MTDRGRFEKALDEYVRLVENTDSECATPLRAEVLRLYDERHAQPATQRYVFPGNPLDNASGAAMNSPSNDPIRDALERTQRHFLAMYRVERGSYNEGASDAADAMLTAYDDAVSGDNNPHAKAPEPPR